MPSAAWAWEFLRHNLDYRRDCIKGLKFGPKVVDLDSGSRLITGKKRYDEARKWGLLFFADPDKNAVEANVFWKPSSYPSTVHVRLGAPVDGPEQETRNFGRVTDTVRLEEFCCRRSMFESLNKSRHIVLKSERYWFQLYCDSPHPIDDQALIEFRVDGGEHSNKRIKSIRQIIALHRGKGGKLGDVGYLRNSERFYKYVTALQIKAAGGSYRDIALALNTRENVAEHWGNDSSALKQQMYRLYKKAEEYSAEKYRTLL